MFFKEHKMISTKKELKKLQKQLDKMTDNRREQGKRHKPSTIVFITIFAILSDCHGLNAIEDFIIKNTDPLKQTLNVKRLPSTSTIRRILMNILWCELEKILRKWIIKRTKIERGCCISLDGKAICGTSTIKHKETTIVSMYNTDRYIVLRSEKVVEKSNEIPIVQKLISLVKETGIYFVADAMHCQKETVKKVANKHNLYMFQVKNNQKTLFKKCKFIGEHTPSTSTDTIQEKNRGRLETRTASVHNLYLDIQYDGWQDLKHIIRIKRTVEEKGKTSEEIAYFITNADLHASEFNKKIRAHWRIENSLHYIKDVTLKEDRLRIRTGQAPQNMSIIRTFILNLLRLNGETKIASAIRRIASDFVKLINLICLNTH